MLVSHTIALKGWLRKILLKLIKKLAHSDFLQSFIWGRNETQSLVTLDIFIDSRGTAFQRLKSWQESIVPRYTCALELQPNTPRVKTKELIGARNAVKTMEGFFQIYIYSIRGIKIIELGCHGAAHACAMAEFGAGHVDGIDIPQYGIRQILGKIQNAKSIERQSEWLSRLREKTIYAFEVASSSEWTFQSLNPVFRPNTFVDISKTLETKIEAMKIYETETRSFPHPRSTKALISSAQRWGSVAGIKAAEPFELIREVR
jgi:hypothetical protein